MALMICRIIARCRGPWHGVAQATTNKMATTAIALVINWGIRRKISSRLLAVSTGAISRISRGVPNEDRNPVGQDGQPGIEI
jgi:hypothetical protein